MIVSPRKVEIDAELSEKGLLALEIEEAEQSGTAGLATQGELRTGEFAYRLVGPDGTVWDELGKQADLPLAVRSAIRSTQAVSTHYWKRPGQC